MSEEETLYHYCSNEAFHSIIKNGTIRLNDISHSNDYMEGKWIEKRITSLLENQITHDKISYVIETLKLFHSKYSVFAFCLSSEGDMLGQWRGYADDGHGIAIGFNKKYLMEKWTDNGINLSQICYEEKAQEDLLRENDNLDKLITAMENYPFRQPLSLISREPTEEEKKQKKEAEVSVTLILLIFMLKSYLIKNPAFREEREQILIKNSFIIEKNDYDRNIDIDFRAARDKIIPYISLSLDPDVYLKSTKSSIITEVKKGPKNQTPDQIIQDFLKKYHFSEVEITKSTATYR